MTRFFSEIEAARRYAAYRPKAHGVIVDWLADADVLHVTRALDVACGTGDSTVPLQAISDEVLGVDVSEAMLAHARDKGLVVQNLDYSRVSQLGEFDLISTCMAFHWFDPRAAVKAFKKASTSDATWLIYNFYFAGHTNNREFNDWIRDGYLASFPSPPRNKTADVISNDDATITQVSKGVGSVPIELTPEKLVNYLSTQTNVEEAVRSGRSYDEICLELLETVRGFDLSGPFNYGYTYEIYRYKRGR